MAEEIFTESWAEAWCREMNESEAYSEAAETWEGAIVLRLAPDASWGIEEERSVWVDLHHGECRGVREATEEDLRDAPYVIRADPYTWDRVLKGELDPISGLMRGKLKLKRGSIVSLARYVTAAKELVAAATRVETRFPDAWEEAAAG